MVSAAAPPTAWSDCFGIVTTQPCPIKSERLRQCFGHTNAVDRGADCRSQCRPTGLAAEAARAKPWQRRHDGESLAEQLCQGHDGGRAAEQDVADLLLRRLRRRAVQPFKAETLDDPRVRRKLQDYVCVQLPLDAKITVDGKEVTLLEHAAFHEMLGRPGIAIVDFRSSDRQAAGAVVSTFPITEKLWYTPEQMAVILDLPPGTLTQRTLIYAVRIHPDKPASTDGELSPDLLEEAQSHSQYQADIRLQGHHFWESRFQRIVARLPGGLTAREVCAESWPGENLVEAAIECVRCWRLSDGHWSAVRAPNRCFGYDMKRGSNGVWYATGIFGAR